MGKDTNTKKNVPKVGNIPKETTSTTLSSSFSSSSSSSSKNSGPPQVTSSSSSSSSSSPSVTETLSLSKSMTNNNAGQKRKRPETTEITTNKTVSVLSYDPRVYGIYSYFDQKVDPEKRNFSFVFSYLSYPSYLIFSYFPYVPYRLNRKVSFLTPINNEY